MTFSLLIDLKRNSKVITWVLLLPSIDTKLPSKKTGIGLRLYWHGSRLIMMKRPCKFDYPNFHKGG